MVKNFCYIVCMCVCVLYKTFLNFIKSNNKIKIWKVVCRNYKHVFDRKYDPIKLYSRNK